MSLPPDHRRITSDRLRYHRKRAGFKQSALAARCPPHITAQRLSDYEAGRRLPTPENLDLIAAVLGVPYWCFHQPLSAEQEAEL